MLKQLFKQAWQNSDNQQSLQNALKEHGFWLARGDRRGFVAVDYKGEVYSLSRWMDIKTKELKQRLSQSEQLPSVQEAKAEIGQSMSDILKKHIDNAHQQRKQDYAPLKRAIQIIKTQHQNQRDVLRKQHGERWQQEEQQRIARLSRGLSGIWQRITGKYKEIRQKNKQETKQCTIRDRDEKQATITRQLQERQRLQERILHIRNQHNHVMLELRQDIGRYHEMGEQALEKSQAIQHQHINDIQHRM